MDMAGSGLFRSLFRAQDGSQALIFHTQSEGTPDSTAAQSVKSCKDYQPFDEHWRRSVLRLKKEQIVDSLLTPALKDLQKSVAAEQKEDTERLKHDLARYVFAFSSARRFIESHVADYDITPEMASRYREYETYRDNIDAALHAVDQPAQRDLGK
jgi:hypothetical protein